MTYTGHMGIKRTLQDQVQAAWPRSLSLNEHTLNSVVCKISCESMGLAKKPTHASHPSPVSPALQGDSLLLSHQGKSVYLMSI